MNISYNLDHLLTVQQFAEKLGVKVRTVRSWIYKRVVPFTRFERRVYFSATVVEQMLSHNAVPAFDSSVLPDSKPTGHGGEKKTKEVTK